ncbi:hypothetical protein [Salmonirosea aquatica]|uniref:Outer membrane beta-barrel protein n=1 Tax=Salmonirosea aquatica TaxID=2654236 RepID=A0A7C9BDP2_9BACT|nr:hypothetical protein [Cytophagaceae bacterium SJW1-29]
MKNLLCTLAIGCFTLLNPVLAQSKLSVSINAAPTFQYANTELTANLPGENGSAVPVDFHSKVNGYGYMVGVLANYGFFKRLSVATGLWLNQVNYRKPTVTTDPDLNTLHLDIQVQTLATKTRSLQVPS